MTSIVRNATKLVFVQSTNYLFPLIALPFLLLNLGDEAFTQLMVSQAIVQYFVLLVTYGFNYTTTKEVSVYRDNKTKLTQIFYTTLLSKIFLLGVSLSIILILFNSVDYVNQLGSLLVVCTVRLVGEAVFPLWFFQGTEKMNFIVISSTISKAISFAFLFLMVEKPDDVIISAFLLSLPTFISGVVALFYIKKIKVVYGFYFSYADIVNNLKQSFPIFISSAISSVYTNSAILIASIFFPASSSAAFAAADKLRLAVQNLLEPVSSAIYPRCSKEIASGVSIKFVLKKYASPFICIGLVFSLVMGLVGDDLALLYFSGNILAADIFQAMFILPLVISASLVFGYWILVPIGASKLLVKIYGMGSVVFVASVYPLVSYLSVLGLVISIVLTESVIVLFMIFSVWRINKNGNL